MRNEAIYNQVNNFVVKNPYRDKIQTRLQDKILIFKDPTTELTKKSVHDIIQKMAKAKKGSTIITGFELDG